MKNRTPIIVAAAALTLLVSGAALAAGLTKRQAPMALTFLAGDGIVASVWVDPDTLCEYLVRGDNIIPRLGMDGKPKCPAAR